MELEVRFLRVAELPGEDDRPIPYGTEMRQSLPILGLRSEVWAGRVPLGFWRRQCGLRPQPTDQYVTRSISRPVGWRFAVMPRPTQTASRSPFELRVLGFRVDKPEDWLGGNWREPVTHQYRRGKGDLTRHPGDQRKTVYMAGHVPGDKQPNIRELKRRRELDRLFDFQYAL